MSDVPFDEISNSKLKGISRNNNKGWGPITSSTVFNSLKAMQDVHLCMYVCMRVCTVYMFHKVTFDWCLSQLVVAVRLWSWTTSSVVYEGTEWGPQIWSWTTSSVVYEETEWGPQIWLCASRFFMSHPFCRTSHSMMSYCRRPIIQCLDVNLKTQGLPK